MSSILIRARAAVTLMSLVGGVRPKMPMILAKPMYSATVPSQGAKGFQWLPMLVLTKPLRNCTALSSATCALPGASTLRFRVSSRAAISSTAITIHVTTTDSATGIPPNSGMVNAVWVPSSSTRVSLNASKHITSFSRGLSYSPARHFVTLS